MLQVLIDEENGPTLKHQIMRQLSESSGASVNNLSGGDSQKMRTTSSGEAFYLSLKDLIQCGHSLSTQARAFPDILSSPPFRSCFRGSVNNDLLLRRLAAKQCQS